MAMDSEGGSARREEVADAARAPAVGAGGGPAQARHREFYARLTREETQLLLLRNVLYRGLWSEIERDLRRRLERKPYVFRLMHRIEEDLARIARMRAYEEAHQTDLGVFLPPDTVDR